MRASITFGRVFGIRIGAHSSWFLVVALITWSLASAYFPNEHPGWSMGTYWLVAAVTSVLFFASVLIHELGHSLVARREGVPVQGITLFIFGGVSQITREPPTAASEFRIAIAGPLTSLGLAALYWVLGTLLAPFPPLAAPGVYLARINLLLCLFNLLPGFPLDGGRVLRAAIWAWRGNFRSATRWASNAGHLLAFLFVLLGVADILRGNLMNGLWIMFLGWFLNNAAEASYQQVVMNDLLAGVSARDLMEGGAPVVPAYLPLDRLVHEHILTGGEPWFYVGEDGTVDGIIAIRHVNAVPRAQWSVVTAGQAMTPLAAMPHARPEDGVQALLSHMAEASVEQLPVVELGRVIGTVTRDHLLRYIRARSELRI